jgi:hypothetical protein
LLPAHPGPELNKKGTAIRPCLFIPEARADEGVRPYVDIANL